MVKSLITGPKLRETSEEISNYICTIKLSDTNDGTLVEWASNAEDAVEFCHGIYIALLGELKAAFLIGFGVRLLFLLHLNSPFKIE